MTHERLTQGADKLPIALILNRLGAIDNSRRISEYLRKGNNEAETRLLVTRGINELTFGFNSLQPGDPLLDLAVMANTKRLKSVIGRFPLPPVDEITRKELAQGLRSAIPAMVTGQAHRHGVNTYGLDEIRTPSMASSPDALCAGIAMHVYERSMFSRFVNHGIDGIPVGEVVIPWKKDDIIFALEECAMLMHAQAQVGSSDFDPVLLNMIANRTPTYTYCGLGWKSEDDVVTTRREFARFRINQILEPYSRDDHLEGWELITNTFFETEKLPNMRTAFIRAINFLFDVSALPKPKASDFTRLGNLSTMLFD